MVYEHSVPSVCRLSNVAASLAGRSGLSDTATYSCSVDHHRCWPPFRMAVAKVLHWSDQNEEVLAADDSGVRMLRASMV